MRIRAFKYYSPLVVYVLAFFAFTSRGWVSYLPLLYGFGLIPLAELFLKPQPANLDQVSEELVRQDPLYDFILYLIVFLQYPTLFFFLGSLAEPGLGWVTLLGRVLSMGFLCGTFGINVGHELGHRTGRFDRALARLSLLSSLYTHFYIEHNKGHHKRVATPEDPATARYGEAVYTFWLRTIWYSYISAWQISFSDAEKRKYPKWSLYNEMIQLQLVQLLFLAVIYALYGGFALVCFGGAALLGILLLETVNYIEHYGLTRKPLADGRYEPAQPQHSWNSDHVIGRLMLFELSRHSDHHYKASRKYQLLRHHDSAPQMPTGYPGMMLLSLVPPVWFRIMHRRIPS